jgi:PAS domain S-box-containing protein
MLDPEGRVESWSPGAERIKGWTTEEILGRHFRVFYPQEDALAGMPERALELATRDGRLQEEAWRVRKDGTRFWADVTITALHGPDGRLEGFAKVTRDLTERLELEGQRSRLAQEREATRLRDQFLSLAAHELKTPLTALHLQIDAALRDAAAAGPALAERLRRAARGVQRLDRLSDDLLDVSRLATGHFTVAPREMDLAAAAREVVARERDVADLSGSAVQLDAAAPVEGRWDPLRMDRLLTHLLLNALRYGGGHPVLVTVESRGKTALIAVRDQGPIVQPEARARVFRRFEGVPDRSDGGFGLGLYLVAEIAAAHGGEATVDDAPGGGTVFTVKLPRG